MIINFDHLIHLIYLIIPYFLFSTTIVNIVSMTYFNKEGFFVNNALLCSETVKMTSKHISLIFSFIFDFIKTSVKIY
jgi:hypothetical protein